MRRRQRPHIRPGIRFSSTPAITDIGMSGLTVGEAKTLAAVVTFWWLAGGVNAYVNTSFFPCTLNTECSMRMRYQDQGPMTWKYSPWFGPFTEQAPPITTKICLVSQMIVGHTYLRQMRLIPTDLDNWIDTGWFQWGDNFVQPAKRDAPLEEEYVPEGT